MMAKVWHVYGSAHTTIPGVWVTMTIELSQPKEMPYTMKGMPYLGSFDHEPTEAEMEILQQANAPESVWLRDEKL